VTSEIFAKTRILLEHKPSRFWGWFLFVSICKRRDRP
jgi:hypothetical protein